MYPVQQITSDPNQQQTLVLPDGSTLSLTIRFAPMQYGWFITSLVYPTFTIQGMRICNNPNMLQQWKNILPFGLGCFSTAQREPSLQQDFSSGASQLFILTAAEVQQFSEFLSA